jgi:hypothetical protein
MEMTKKATKLIEEFEKVVKGRKADVGALKKISDQIRDVNRQILKVTTVLDSREGLVRDAVIKAPQDAKARLSDFGIALKTFWQNKNFPEAIRINLDDVKKANDPDLYRALKVLLSGVEEMSAYAEYCEKAVAQNVRDIGKEMDAHARTQELALSQVKKAATKSLAWLQKINSDPTPTKWDQAMNNGMTRDVIMALVALQEAQEDSGKFNEIPKARSHYEVAKPWNTGQPRTKTDKTTDERRIKAMKTEWSQIVKDISANYQRHW